MYFMYYSRVVIIFFSTGLEKSAFSTYSFGFCLSMFYFFVFLFLCVSVSLLFCTMFWIQCLNRLNNLQVIKINVLFKFVFTLFRSSHRRWFIKKAVLKNFAIFTWKHLCWSLFLRKLQAFRSATLLERDSNTNVLLSLLRKF